MTDHLKSSVKQDEEIHVTEAGEQEDEYANEFPCKKCGKSFSDTPYATADGYWLCGPCVTTIILKINAAAPPSTSEVIKQVAEEIASIAAEDPSRDRLLSVAFKQRIVAILSRWFGKGETESVDDN